jgi:FkbM family methyltransferase
MENIEINKIENILSYKLGIIDDNKTIELYLSSNENLGMSSIFHHDTESGEVENVKAVKLDDFISENNIKKVNLIKIDIEGAEIFALKGMVNTLKKFTPILLVEISENVIKGNVVRGDDVFNFMRNIGYSPYSIKESGEVSPFNIETEELRTNYVFIHG